MISIHTPRHTRAHTPLSPLETAHQTALFLTWPTCRDMELSTVLNSLTLIGTHDTQLKSPFTFLPAVSHEASLSDKAQRSIPVDCSAGAQTVAALLTSKNRFCSEKPLGSKGQTLSLKMKMSTRLHLESYVMSYLENRNCASKTKKSSLHNWGTL